MFENKSERTWEQLQSNNLSFSFKTEQYVDSFVLGWQLFCAMWVICNSTPLIIWPSVSFHLQILDIFVHDTFLDFKMWKFILFIKIILNSVENIQNQFIFLDFFPWCFCWKRVISFPQWAPLSLTFVHPLNLFGKPASKW